MLHVPSIEGLGGRTLTGLTALCWRHDRAQLEHDPRARGCCGNCASTPTTNDREDLRQRAIVVLVRECDRRIRVRWPLPKRV